MVRSLMLLFFIATLGACGNDQPAPTQQKAAASAPASARPAAAMPEEAMQESSASGGATTAEMDDDEVVYDPIDVSKLENQWWKQYSTGS